MQKVERPNYALIPVSEVLNGLVCEQAEEFKPQKMQKAPQKAFGWYINTDRFKAAYNDQAKFFLMPHNAHEIDLNQRYFSGRVFEDLAFYFTATAELRKGNIVLSPERTMKFYERLYPQPEKIITSIHINGGLEQVSVPDGIVVARAGIIGIVEYTISRLQKVDSKKASFARSKVNHPNILGRASISFVTPEGVLSGDDVRNLPFSLNEYVAFLNFAYLKYSNGGENATLNDLKTRIQAQYNRAIEHSKSGKLTAEERKYLNKIAGSPQMI